MNTDDESSTSVGVDEARPDFHVTNTAQNSSKGHDASLSLAAPAVQPSSLATKSAICVAQNPWTHFCSAWLVVLAVSAIGLVVGDFSVTADNLGWTSRGTLIADRHTQVGLVRANRKDLARSDNSAMWENLLGNVQPGWETSKGAAARSSTQSRALGGKESCITDW